MKLHIKAALTWGIQELEKAGVETSIFDAEVLLAHGVASESSRRRSLSAAIPIDRAWLYGHPEMLLRDTVLIQYKNLIARRAKREPVAYILGHKEFYGLDFLVNKNVLIPRPETELLVEEVCKYFTRYKLHATSYTIVDVGTGSGAIAVAVAKSSQSSVHSSRVRFFATDISSAALRVARKNARRQGVADRIKFLKGDLLEPLLKQKDGILRSAQNDVLRELIVVANLPYLPTFEWRGAMPEVRKYEPRGALDGGKDGLRYYRELFEQFHRWFHNSPQPSLNLREGGRSVPTLRLRGGEGELRTTIICEICPEQVSPFKKLVRNYFTKATCDVIKDLSGRDRVMKVRLN